MKQRVLSIMIALLGIAAGAWADDLKIGGTPLTVGQTYNNMNGPSCLWAGTITFTDATHVTFDNVTLNFNTSNSIAISTDISNLTITLTGTNKIQGEGVKIGLYFNGKTTIAGDGSLEITSATEDAIQYVNAQSLTIDGASVKVKGTRYGVKGGGLTSSLTMKGKACLQTWGDQYCFYGIGLLYGGVVTSPVGATFQRSKPGVVDETSEIIKGKWVTIQAGIVIDETNFPDANFRNWLSSQSYVLNNKFITNKDIASVTSIDVHYQNISSLTGIEFFTALTSLECMDNPLASLDVSKNTALTYLDCWACDLTSLDVSKNTELVQLLCVSNQLEDLDVSNNTKLEILSCNSNKLTSLDLSKNTALSTLNCYFNQLTSLDVSKNTALTTLCCYNNKIQGSGMQTLVNSLPSVTNGELIVYSESQYNPDGNRIYDHQVAAAKAKGWTVKKIVESSSVEYEGVLTVSIDETNFPDANFRKWILAQDYGKDGYLTDEEIAEVTKIKVYMKSIADLKGIEYFTALTYLNCLSNNLTSLDLSKNTALTSIECTSNNLGNIELPENTILEHLVCYDNPTLKELDVSQYTALKTLNCDYTGLTTLDVSKNTKLTGLSCFTCKLTSLDVSKNTELISLRCFGNKLSKLDVSQNNKLEYLNCYGNQIRGNDMEALVNSLPIVSGGKLFIYSKHEDNSITGNRMTTEQVAAAKAKGWNVLTDTDKENYEGIIDGDANGDTKVNAADIVAIVNHKKGIAVEGFDANAADVNGDSSADEKDIELIQKIILGE